MQVFLASYQLPVLASPTLEVLTFRPVLVSLACGSTLPEAASFWTTGLRSKTLWNVYVHSPWGLPTTHIDCRVDTLSSCFHMPAGQAPYSWSAPCLPLPVPFLAFLPVLWLHLGRLLQPVVAQTLLSQMDSFLVLASSIESRTRPLQLGSPMLKGHR